MTVTAHKYSRQRELILKILRSSKDHPTAEDIYRQSKASLPKISLGTVYRNLNFLYDEGKIQRFSFQKSLSRFDGDCRDHYHLRCKECQNIEDVSHDFSGQSFHDIEAVTGFQVHGVQITFIGICRNCRKTREVK
jgi:Fur family peroxide stress response transcriptional regulator